MTTIKRRLVIAGLGLLVAAAIAVPVVARQQESEDECHSAIVCSLWSVASRIGLIEAGAR